MASRKSAKNKKKKSTAEKKTKSAKNTPEKKRVAKNATSPKTVSKKAAKKISAARKLTAASSRKARNRRSQAAFPRERMTERSGQLSGDLQGLSGVAGADSESVDELLEEGNAFEADAVKGVEDAGNTPMREVHTREVPEDDVPEEYLDPDR